LFYIGLYQLDIKLLRTNLIALFMVDEFRRVACEVILPYLMQNTGKEIIKRAKTILHADGKQQDNTKLSVEEEIIREEIEELDKDEMELFDDYLEMIMTFGYITLFAAAFPLGATVTSIFIYIETKSDTYKMEKLSRRPFSRKQHNIGVWELTLDLFTFSAVFTNIILACFASDQIDAILPFMAGLKEESLTSVLTVFSIEHFLIIFVVVVRYCFEDAPRWV
jgi:anoctamin-10